MRSWIRFDGLEMLLEGMARNKIDATESWDELLEVFIMREKRRFASNWMLVQRILDRVFGLAGCGWLRPDRNLESNDGEERSGYGSPQHFESWKLEDTWVGGCARCGEVEVELFISTTLLAWMTCGRPISSRATQIRRYSRSYIFR